MRRISIALCFAILSGLLRAQSITLDPISKLAYCDGDSITISYHASGTFMPDNHFFIEISDAKGSFNSFSTFGNDSSLNGFFKFKLSTLNSGDRMRIASTDPYAISDTSNSIQVYALPNPEPWASKYKLNIQIDIFDTIMCGLTSQKITFGDWNYQTGSNYVWKFGQDAEPTYSTEVSPVIVYSQAGIKTGSVMVTTPSGCSVTLPVQFRIGDCDPIIPADVHIVTGTESGAYNSVWVKPGGKFIQSAPPVQMGFIESGGSIDLTTPGGTYFVQPGASVVLENGPGTTMLVLKTGNPISYENFPNNIADTFYCPDLTFDYSQVQSSVSENPVPMVSIRQIGNQLFTHLENSDISFRIFNTLGSQVLSREGFGSLDLDLSVLPSGLYFVVVNAGGMQKVQKISIVHER